MIFYSSISQFPHPPIRKLVQLYLQKYIAHFTSFQHLHDYNKPLLFSCWSHLSPFTYSPIVHSPQEYEATDIFWKQNSDHFFPLQIIQWLPTAIKIKSNSLPWLTASTQFGSLRAPAIQAFLLFTHASLVPVWGPSTTAFLLWLNFPLCPPVVLKELFPDHTIVILHHWLLTSLHPSSSSST